MSNVQFTDTWQDLSTFHKNLLKAITYSDLDKPECGTVCYTIKGPQENWQQEDQSNVAPLILQSLFYVRTRTAEVKMPSGKVDKPVIEDNRDGTISIKYEPREEGLHEVYVKYNGEHVQGSPFKFHVDSLASGYVTAYGPGLIYGVCGEPSNFTISTKGAGAGGLSLAVEGPSKAEISCHDNKDGTVSVSYLPTAPGEYKISVKFGDKHIKGSPYVSKITASPK